MEGKIEIDKSLVLESASLVSLLFFFCVFFKMLLFVFVFSLFRLAESRHKVSLKVKIN